ncbi:MAG: hypothetical protein FVQ78_08325 [Solirubrobacterales bacterium]|nr:hypothetical protein [Solirubrobacterales bacterium]
MAEINPTDCAERDPDTPAAQDAQAEHVVLAFLLEEHPSHLTIPELSRALNAYPNSFETNDAVERAVRELVGAGLLRCQGGDILPTRAALYFERLQPLG